MGRLRRRREQAQQSAWLFRRHRNANMLARPGRHPFVVVLDGLKSDFNIGKIFRSADAFGARELHLVGIESFDPAAARGSFKWVPAHFHSEFSSCYTQLCDRAYTLFALQAKSGSEVLGAAGRLPEKSAFILGHEVLGLSFELSDYPLVRPLRIPQFGRVESLNVSVAASIVMYEYLRQHGRL